MRHFLLIDEIGQLNCAKDSSFYLAKTLKDQGHEVFLFFVKDFSIHNTGPAYQLAYDFTAEFDETGYYLKDVALKDQVKFELTPADLIHMRLDPPFDSRYLRYLWMLDFWQQHYGLRVMNNPRGIMHWNEKITAYTLPSSLDSFIGASPSSLEMFMRPLLEAGLKDFIFKPLDLYQGIGVEKVEFQDMESFQAKFVATAKVFQGPIVVQPFVPEVAEGEIRSIFFKGEHLGSIIKIPPKNQFLANIAQGAAYHAVQLEDEVEKSCKGICELLKRDGVDWIAFDILGGSIQEVNVTCPGLLVEVSKANQKNLAALMEWS